jgi:hypothetical protein
MPDKYTEKQLQHYEDAKSEAAQNDALYRLGTYLEVIKCDGNNNLTPEQRDTVLDAAKKGDE